MKAELKAQPVNYEKRRMMMSSRLNQLKLGELAQIQSFGAAPGAR
jgi:hypothetical protein